MQYTEEVGLLHSLDVIALPYLLTESKYPQSLLETPSLSPTERANSIRMMDYVFEFIQGLCRKPDPVTEDYLRSWVTEDLLYIDPSLDKPSEGYPDFVKVLETLRQSFGSLKFSIHQLFPDGDEVTLNWSYRGDLLSGYPGLKSGQREVYVVGMTRVEYFDGRVRKIWQIFQSVEDEVALSKARLADTNDPANSDDLTKRETETYRWICEGKSNDEIATILSTSVRTVSKHCQNVFAKLGVENRKAAMVQGILSHSTFTRE